MFSCDNNFDFVYFICSFQVKKTFWRLQVEAHVAYMCKQILATTSSNWYAVLIDLWSLLNPC